jgi:hypothetical protein
MTDTDPIPAADLIAAAAAAADLGIPASRKSGRNARWPYLPVVVTTGLNGGTRTTVIPKRAFATSAEAVEYATRHIDSLRSSLARTLADPSARALREQHGLPRNLTDTYLRQRTTSAETGTTVELYDAHDPESVYDEVGGRWVTTCVDHGDVVNHPTLELAHRWLRYSETWCVACADEWVDR